MKKPKAIAISLIFAPIVATVYFGRLVSFNMMETDSAGYIDSIVRGYVFINSNKYEGVDKWIVFPLWPAHANCKPWLPQEIWRECNAIAFDAPISDDEIINIIKESIEGACHYIEIMSSISYNDISNNRNVHPSNIVNSSYLNIEYIEKSNEYFSCRGGVKRKEKLYIYRTPIHPPGEIEEKPFAVIEFYH